MSSALRQAGALGVGFALIIISAGLAVYYIASAGAVWLSMQMDPVWAMLITGGVLALPLLAFALAAFLRSRARRRLSAAEEIAFASPHIEVHEPESLSRLALRVAGDLFKERPVTTISLALGVAALVARYPAAAAMVARKLISQR